MSKKSGGLRKKILRGSVNFRDPKKPSIKLFNIPPCPNTSRLQAKITEVLPHDVDGLVLWRPAGVVLGHVGVGVDLLPVGEELGEGHRPVDAVGVEEQLVLPLGHADHGLGAVLEDAPGIRDVTSYRSSLFVMGCGYSLSLKARAEMDLLQVIFKLPGLSGSGDRD